MAMTWNGILVTSALPSPETPLDTRYRGVAYGAVWPLEELDASNADDEDIDLINAINEEILFVHYEDGKYPPAVIADIALVNRYIQRCKLHNIPIRTLLCATERPDPALSADALKQVLPVAKFLGYDYAYSSCRFSALYSDLHPKCPSNLLPYSLLLNEFGLFGRRSDLEDYENVRKTYIKSIGQTFQQVGGQTVRVTPLEDNGDFIAIEVWEFVSPV